MSETKNTTQQPATKPIVATKVNSALAKYADIYSNQIEQMAKNSELKLSISQKLAVTIGAQNIYTLCATNKVDIKSLDHSNVSKVLFNLAVLGLNPNAVPHECYLIIRKNNVKVVNEQGKEIWVEKPTVELGIEGDGNDSLVRKYGVDVKSLSSPMIVREGDEFTLPYFDGEKMCAPTWKPKNLSGKPIYVFYVLTKTDGTKEYPIADRESVANNLKAHIINNLQNIDDRIKNPIINKIDTMTLDQLLTDESIRSVKAKKYNTSTHSYEDYDKSIISPAYLNPHSRESMIIRKMRNNCLTKYPKDFGNAFLANAYESTFEDSGANNNTFVPDPQKTVEAEFSERANIEESKSVMMQKEEPQADDNGVVDENVDTSKKQMQQNEIVDKKEELNVPDWAM